MFARFLELKAKKGQGRALLSLLEEKLPVVKKSPGFLDEAHLIPEESPDSVLIVSFWDSRESAENFRKEHYRALADAYRALLESEIRVLLCDVPIGMASLAKAKAARR